MSGENGFRGKNKRLPEIWEEETPRPKPKKKTKAESKSTTKSTGGTK